MSDLDDLVLRDYDEPIETKGKAMTFTHKLFYDVKASDGYDDQLQFAGALDSRGELIVLNGGKWYKPQGSLNPDKVVELSTGKILSPIERLEIGCRAEFKNPTLTRR